MMKRSRIHWLALGLMAITMAAPVAYYVSAKLRGEHFYRGRPTSYWSQELRRWSDNPSGWSPSLVDRLMDRAAGKSSPPIPALISEVGVDPRVLPVFLDIMHHRDSEVRLLASGFMADFLGGLDDLSGAQGGATRVVLENTPPETIHLLVKGLADGDARMRQDVAIVLGAFGPHAKPAVPALVAALQDEDEDVRLWAANALKRVDPDRAAQVGVK